MILSSFLVCNTLNQSEILEIDFGQNNPTGLYNKYASPGFSARIAYSKSFKKNGLLKWQAGAQYISFRSDYWNDNVQGENTPLWNVDINNYEQGFIINGGLRFTANNGFSKKGNFRPYIGVLVGYSFFSERTSYNWGNDCTDLDQVLNVVFDTNPCDNNNNTNVRLIVSCIACFY